MEIEDGEAPKLKGLTIVGKIELKKGEAQKKTRKEKKGKVKKVQEKEDKHEEESTKAKSKSKRGKPGKVEETPKRNKRKRKQNIREMITEEDVDSAIKKTLAGMDESSNVSKRQSVRHKRKIEKEEKEQK